MIVADGLINFSSEVKKHFPGTDVQRCVVHLMRNYLNKVRPKDKQEFSTDLKNVFDKFESIDTKVMSKKKIKEFVNKSEKSYKFVVNLSNEDYIEDYLTYIDYPIEVRRMIYTTNSIENLNRQIRKVTKTKVTFDKEENLLDLIYMVIKDFEFSNWQKYPIHNFRSCPKFTHAV